MKTIEEFISWLEREGRNEVILLCSEDFEWLWARVAGRGREGDSLIINGRSIRRALSPDTLNVSDRRLFE